MDNIIKSFEFESEAVKLTLNIKKEIHRNYLRLVIDGNLISNNNDLIKNESRNSSSLNTSLSYLNHTIFWMSSNEWKGLRWENYSNETKFSVFRSVGELKESYIIQREFIDRISSYFYDSIKNYKRIKLLYETKIEEILTEEKN